MYRKNKPCLQIKLMFNNQQFVQCLLTDKIYHNPQNVAHQSISHMMKANQFIHLYH